MFQSGLSHSRDRYSSLRNRAFTTLICKSRLQFENGSNVGPSGPLTRGTENRSLSADAYLVLHDPTV